MIDSEFERQMREAEQMEELDANLNTVAKTPKMVSTLEILQFAALRVFAATDPKRLMHRQARHALKMAAVFEQVIKPHLASVNRLYRQLRVYEWTCEAFGWSAANSLPHRGVRLLEEAAETAQAAGVEREMAHKLIDYVFDRPKGELTQEIGGVGVTLLALANAANLNVDECEANEVARVLSKPLEHFRKRNQAKNDLGFNAVQQNTGEGQ